MRGELPDARGQRGAKRSAPLTRPCRWRRRWDASGRPWPACGLTGSSMTSVGAGADYRGPGSVGRRGLEQSAASAGRSPDPEPFGLDAGPAGADPPGPTVTRGRAPSVVLAGVPGTGAGHAPCARGADGRHGTAPVSASGPGLARGIRTRGVHRHPHGACEQCCRGHEQGAAHAPGTAPPGEPGHAGSQTGVLELPPLYAWQTAWGVSVPTTWTPPPDRRLVGALTDGSGSIGAKTVNSRRYAVRQSHRPLFLQCPSTAILLAH